MRAVKIERGGLCSVLSMIGGMEQKSLDSFLDSAPQTAIGMCEEAVEKEENLERKNILFYLLARAHIHKGDFSEGLRYLNLISKKQGFLPFNVFWEDEGRTRKGVSEAGVSFEARKERDAILEPVPFG
jgi:hypothetical protein